MESTTQTPERSQEVSSTLELQDMVSELFMIGIESGDLKEDLFKEIEQFNPGSVILTLRLFSRNGSTDPKFLSSLCDTIHRWKSKPLIGIDHEGGRIQHLPPPNYTHFPPEGDIGQLNDENIAEQLGEAMGKELRAVGIDWNFAPVLDVASNPNYHFRHIKRAISSDPKIVSKMGTSLVRGMQKGGIIACPKHFPGMGATPDDSHYQRPVIDRKLSDLQKTEFAPFQSAFTSGGAMTYMTNHALYPSLDPDHVATLSSTILTLSRTELGFGSDGVILTDDLGMAGVMKDTTVEKIAIDSLKAGVDVLMFSFRFNERVPVARQAILEALKKGELDVEIVKRSYNRIRQLKERHRQNVSQLPPLTISDLPDLVKQHKSIVEKFPDPLQSLYQTQTSVGCDASEKEEKSCIVT